MFNQLLSFSSTMKSIGGVVLAIVILLVMVTIHEFGHYIAGKLLHFKIEEFSVGFGPAIFKKRSKKTGELFALRVIPLGGYCAFDGEDDTDDADSPTPPPAEPFEDMSSKSVSERSESPLPASDGRFADASAPLGQSASAASSSVPSATEDSRSLDAGSAPVSDGRATSADFPPSANSPSASAASSAASPSSLRPESAVLASHSVSEGKKFNDQPPWKRIIVLIAGATMNYLLALVIIIIMFTCVGQPQYAVMQKPDDSEQETSQTVSDPTDTTRLLPGDVIVSVEGKSMFLLTDYVDALRGKKAGDTAEIEVVRNDRPMTLEVVLAKDANFKNMSDVYVVLDALGIYGLMGTPVKQSFFGAVGDSFVYSGKLGGLVLRSLGELLTGKMGLDSMGGPVTTIKATSEAALSGIWSFLNISGFIGVNLAVFNLLPIPALDGSKVVFTVIEWIRKKPINRKVEAMIHFIGIIFLFGFAILVDILQLFV